MTDPSSLFHPSQRSRELTFLHAAIARAVIDDRGPPPVIDDLDWGRVQRLAARQRVEPLLYHALSTGDLHGPDDMLSELRRRAIAATARAARLADRTHSAVDRLAQAGIRALPVKGPVIAAMAYPDMALRTFDDIDLLVHPGDMPAAKAVLMSDGFRPHIELRPSVEPAYVRAGWEYIFIAPDNDYALEIGTGIAPRQFFKSWPFDDLWDRRQSYAADPLPFVSVGLEDALLLLCIHGTKHRWERLQWTADILGLLARHPEVDWARCRQLAASSGCQRLLRLGLELAGRLAPATVANAVANGDDAAARCLADAAERRQDEEEPARSEWQALRYRLRARERWRDRLRYLVILFFAPSYGDWAAIRLPPGLAPLYWILRPPRLLWKLLRRRARPESLVYDAPSARPRISAE